MQRQQPTGPAITGAGMDSASRNALLGELATMAESGGGNQELLQYAMGKGLDRENAIALIKRAKRQAQGQAAGGTNQYADQPPGMGGGQYGGVSDQPLYSGHSHSTSGYVSAGSGGDGNGGAIVAILAGIGMIALGIGITVISYSAAKPGGSYRIALGLPIVGFITLVKGVAALGKR